MTATAGLMLSRMRPAEPYIERLVQLTVRFDAVELQQLRADLRAWRARTGGRTPELEALEMLADAVEHARPGPWLERHAKLHFSPWRLGPLNTGVGWGFDVWRRQAAEMLVCLLREDLKDTLSFCSANLDQHYPASPVRSLHDFARAAAGRVPPAVGASAPRINAATPLSGGKISTSPQRPRTSEFTVRVVGLGSPEAR